MHRVKLSTLLLFFVLVVSKVGAQNIIKKAEHEFDAVNAAVFQLYQDYPIVAIGEGQHNSALTFQWLNTLLNEKQFPDVVNNIVVEFGASEYQQVMDDFVNNKDVPDSLLKKCWRETTQILVWDNPIYEAFFRQVRQRNNGLPANKRIRVLLGDPSFGSNENRDEHCFNIIKKEVLEKNQTALLIFGDLHFVKRDVFTNYAPVGELKKEFLNVIQQLEIDYPDKAISIWGSINTNDSITKQILVKENIRVGSLVRMSDSRLGDVDFRVFYPYPTHYRTDNMGRDIDTSQHIQMTMKHIVDYIIYRGSWEEQNYLAPRPDDLYTDTFYLNELIRREQLVNIPPYRVRLYFYKVLGSKEFLPFANAMENGNINSINSLYQPLKGMIPEANRMDVLNYAGYFYLRKKEIKKSIGVFKLAVREYPDKFNPYLGLGDAYLANEEKGKAIKSYEDALLRSPGNKMIKDKIDQLKIKDSR